MELIYQQYIYYANYDHWYIHREFDHTMVWVFSSLDISSDYCPTFGVIIIHLVFLKQFICIMQNLAQIRGEIKERGRSFILEPTIVYKAISLVEYPCLF